jgi:hypothetical protein
MASHNLPVQLACRVLGVSESVYYDWRTAFCRNRARGAQRTAGSRRSDSSRRATV